MKITTVNKSKTKLLRLKLLKTKIYKNERDFSYLFLKNMETRLKKVLHIIYKFHVANKKILFIGTPIELNSQIKQLLKNKKHSFLPESIWLNGIITNSKPSFKHLSKRHALSNDRTSKSLFNLKNQADLIVVLNEKLNITALKESSLKRITTISLNSNYNLLNVNLSTYKVTGDYTFVKKTVRSSLFFLLLSSLLKKADFLRKKQAHINAKQKKSKWVKTPWNSIYNRKNVFSKKK